MLTRSWRKSSPSQKVPNELQGKSRGYVHMSIFSVSHVSGMKPKIHLTADEPRGKGKIMLQNVRTMKLLGVKQHSSLKTNKYIKWNEAKLMLLDQAFKTEH